MRLLIAIAAMLVSGVVWAAGTTATVSFLPVTEYIDNSPLPTTDILKYTVKWQGGSLDVAAPPACPSGGRLCVTVPVPCGDRDFVVTVTTKATAKYPSATAQDSAPPAVYASGVACVPKSPTGVTVS